MQQSASCQLKKPQTCLWDTVVFFPLSEEGMKYLCHLTDPF